MGAFAKGDIVLFPFPFTDLRDRKLRPCLVMSEEMGQDILLCQITSRNLKKDKYCIEVPKESTLDGSLHIDSYVRANKLFTAETAMILRKICKLDKKRYQRVVKTVNETIK